MTGSRDVNFSFELSDKIDVKGHHLPDKFIDQINLVTLGSPLDLGRKFTRGPFVTVLRDGSS